jgi:hypothetical protein
MRSLITVRRLARQCSSPAVICAAQRFTTDIGVHLLQPAGGMDHGIFRTAGQRSRGCQRNRRLVLGECLPMLTYCRAHNTHKFISSRAHRAGDIIDSAGRRTTHAGRRNAKFRSAKERGPVRPGDRGKGHGPRVDRPLCRVGWSCSAAVGKDVHVDAVPPSTHHRARARGVVDRADGRRSPDPRRIIRTAQLGRSDPGRRR